MKGGTPSQPAHQLKALHTVLFHTAGQCPGQRTPWRLVHSLVVRIHKVVTRSERARLRQPPVPSRQQGLQNNLSSRELVQQIAHNSIDPAWEAQLRLCSSPPPRSQEKCTQQRALKTGLPCGQVASPVIHSSKGHIHVISACLNHNQPGEVHRGQLAIPQSPHQAGCGVSCREQESAGRSDQTASSSRRLRSIVLRLASHCKRMPATHLGSPSSGTSPSARTACYPVHTATPACHSTLPIPAKLSSCFSCCSAHSCPANQNLTRGSKTNSLRTPIATPRYFDMYFWKTAGLGPQKPSHKRCTTLSPNQRTPHPCKERQGHEVMRRELCARNGRVKLRRGGERERKHLPALQRRPCPLTELP